MGSKVSTHCSFNQDLHFIVKQDYRLSVINIRQPQGHPSGEIGAVRPTVKQIKCVRIRNRGRTGGGGLDKKALTTFPKQN